MVEFESLSKFETLAPKEYELLKESIDKLTLRAEGFGGTNIIEERFFKLIFETIAVQIEPFATFIIRKAISEGKNESEVVAFIHSLRKKVSESIEPLLDDSLKRSADDKIFSIIGLNLTGYLFDKLKLSLQVALDQKASTGISDLSSLKSSYEQLKNHPATEVLDELATSTNDYPNNIPGLDTKTARVESHPEMVRTEPVLAEEASLQSTPKNEYLGLDLLFGDLGIPVELGWLDNPNKNADDPLKTLVWLLEITETSLGVNDTDISMYHGNLKELKAAILEVFAKTSAPLFKKNNPDIQAYFDQYDLSEDRLKELVVVINRLLDGDKRSYEVWERNISNFLLYENKDVGETPNQFLSRLEAAADPNLSDKDKKDLLTLKNYYKSVKDNLSLITISSGDQLQKIRDAQNEFLEKELSKLTALEERAGLSDRAKSRAERPPFETNEEVAIKMYEEIRSEYPSLPPFESLEEYPIEDFNKEMVSAIAVLVRKELNISTGSGGTVINLPGESVVLFDKIKFKIQSGLQPGDNSLVFFFENFPWQVMIPDFTKADAKSVFGNVWELRLLHISLIHNSMSRIRKVLNTSKKPEFPETIRSIMEDLAKDGGGYKENATYYQKKYKPGSAEEKMFGVEDESWVVPNLELFFTQMCELYCPGLIVDDQKGKNKLEKWKAQFIEMIPNELMPSSDQVIDMAWDMAVWKLYLSLRMFEYDKDSIDSKMGQRLKSRWYGPKVLPGASNTGTVWNYTYVDSLEKTMIPIADFTHYYVNLKPGEVVYHTTIKDVVEYYTLLEAAENEKDKRDRDPMILKYLERLKEFIVDTKQRSLGKGAIVDKYYQIMWVAPHATNMQQGVKYRHLKLPLAVPQSYIEASKRSGIYGENGNYLVALRDRQIVNSMINPEFVRWDTGTPDWKSQWANATADHNKMFDTIDLEKADNSLPLIEKTPHGPVKAVKMSSLLSDLNELFGKVDKYLDPEKYAKSIHEFIQDKVLVKITHASDLVSHWKIQLITQSIGRYGQQNLSQGGPSDPRVKSSKPFQTLRTAELLLDMPRTQWEGGEVEELKDGEIKKVHYEDLADLWEHSRDKSVIRELTTAVPKDMREAVDLMVLDNGETNKKAETMIIQHFLQLVVGGYLDKYRYKEEVHFEIGVDIADLYEELECACPEAKPMTTPYIEKTINNIIVLVEEFLTSAVYGGNNKDSRIDEAVVRKTIEEMMVDRGILYSPMQAIADTYFIEKELPKLGTGTVTEDAKKH